MLCDLNEHIVIPSPNVFFIFINEHIYLLGLIKAKKKMIR